MYVPSHFREQDERVLAEFIEAYGELIRGM
jgi:predicted FMN-binding regulatory protein PaiB